MLAEIGNPCTLHARIPAYDVMAIKANRIDAAITLDLDEEEITVGDFTSALDHFLGLVREVSKSIDSSASRDWLVKVYEGSAGVGLYSKPGQTRGSLNVVRAAVLDGINALAEGRSSRRNTSPCGMSLG